MAGKRLEWTQGMQGAWRTMGGWLSQSAERDGARPLSSAPVTSSSLDTIIWIVFIFLDQGLTKSLLSQHQSEESLGQELTRPVLGFNNIHSVLSLSWFIFHFLFLASLNSFHYCSAHLVPTRPPPSKPSLRVYLADRQTSFIFSKPSFICPIG